jgi:hypothetical protein
MDAKHAPMPSPCLFVQWHRMDAEYALMPSLWL